jgi:hypothetical protein
MILLDGKTTLGAAQFGAACGLLVGHGIRAAVAAIGAEGSHPVSLQLYAVVGAAAFLAGSVRYKAAAVLITVEATGAWVLTVPITIAGVVLNPSRPCSHGPALPGPVRMNVLLRTLCHVGQDRHACMLQASKVPCNDNCK